MRRVIQKMSLLLIQQEFVHCITSHYISLRSLKDLQHFEIYWCHYRMSQRKKSFIFFCWFVFFAQIIMFSPQTQSTSKFIHTPRENQKEYQPTTKHKPWSIHPELWCKTCLFKGIEK